MSEKTNFDRFLDNLFELSLRIGKTAWEVIRELALSAWRNQLPWEKLFLAGILIPLVMTFKIDKLVLEHFNKDRWVLKGEARRAMTLFLWISPFPVWGLRQNLRRKRLSRKIQQLFDANRITSGLGLSPEYISDEPLDTTSRKLRLWPNGVPLQAFKSNKEALEDGLGGTITKISWGDNEKRVIEIVYTYGSIPDFYVPEVLSRYQDFSFPIGESVGGEIITDLRSIPHYLVAGETGTGKSTFLRMMVELLLMNNELIEVYFLDFKGGIEAQSLSEDRRVRVITDYTDAAQTVRELNQTLDERAKGISGIARNIDQFNKKEKVHSKKMRRILVVVDEIAEIMPRFGVGKKNEVQEINSGITRIARMGRALGLHLVVGTQKPDAKNMDSSIKANLPGIICFPVTHPTQSMLILGDGRAADLNAAIVGRAIWKHGVHVEEVQTPFIADEQIKKARRLQANYWSDESPSPQELRKEVEPEDTRKESSEAIQPAKVTPKAKFVDQISVPPPDQV